MIVVFAFAFRNKTHSKYLKILITSNLIPLFKMKINIVFDLQPKKKLKKIKIRNNIKIYNAYNI